MALATTNPPKFNLSKNSAFVSEETNFYDRSNSKIFEVQNIKYKVKKLNKLLTDPHSKSYTNRHINAARSLVKSCCHGIPLSVVTGFTHVLTSLTQFDIKCEPYSKVFSELIQCLRKPFLMVKASDEEHWLLPASHAITEIGELLPLCTKELCLEVVGSIHSLFTFNRHCQEKSPCGYQNVSSAFLQTIIERSSFGLHTSPLIYSLDNKQRLCLLQYLQRLSTGSLFCNDILSGNGAFHLCSSLNKYPTNDSMVALTTNLLCNLLENGSSELISNQLNCDVAISSLKTTLYNHVICANSSATRQLRNDLVVLTTLIANSCPEAPFVETGFVHFLALLSTYPEVRSNSMITQRLHFHQQNVEDFEFKQLIFTALLAMASSCSAALEVIQEGYVMLGLLTFVHPIDETLETMWTMAQFEELQLQAMDTLCALAPKMLHEYMQCLGNSRLLSLLSWCIESDDFRGHGNSFHGVGGMGCKRAQMRYCLRIIRSICSTGNDSVIQDLCDQTAIDILVGILTNVNESEDDNDAIDAQMQCDMLLILSCLCHGNIHKQELFGDDGVLVLICYLRSNVKRFVKPCDHNQLLLTTVDCIWSTILGCSLKETCFLQHEGLFLLLDLLQVCPENMQNLVLGAVLDLCENPKALPHLLTWTCKNGQPVSKLLIRLWRDEEKRMGVKRSASGMIVDPVSPLINSVQQSYDGTPLPSNVMSPAIIDVVDNIRAKIYSMFYKIGFNDVPGLEAADYITLSIIERFVEFKTLEVWQEISSELKLEGVEPVSPDAETMESIISTLEERSRAVTEMQTMLIEAKNQQDLMSEEECYEKIRESWKQHEMALAKHDALVKRTSDYNALKTAKQEQMNDILLSRANVADQISPSALVHGLIDTSLQTTVFCGRTVAVSNLTLESNRSELSFDKDYEEKELIPSLYRHIVKYVTLVKTAGDLKQDDC